MKLKPIAIAAVATMAASTPVLAKVDAGTGNLIRTIERTGYTVSFGKCEPGIEGYFSPAKKAIVICDHADPKHPDTHDTVRHEAWHLLQHCTTRTTVNPIHRTKAEFVSFVEGNLDQQTQDLVFRSYPQERHAVELEAFTAARVLTAAQIGGAIEKYCL